MKRTICILLAVTMLFMLSSPVFAVGVETRAAERQNRIDEIFKELNELALEKNLQDSATYSTYSASSTTHSEEQMMAINERINELDSQLESLGVHKIDPDCQEDLERLSNVMSNAVAASTLEAGLRTAPVEDPPDLEELATNYSVYQYDESIYVDKRYYGSYIVVVDSKGRGGLTSLTVESRLCGSNSTVLSDLLEYNFNFGFSQFLGIIPYGWAAEWLVGNIFTALNSYNGSSIVTCPPGNTSIYVMLTSSVTQMTYIYIYDEAYSSWVLCGSRAHNLSFARADSLAANIGGNAVAETYSFPNVTSRTGESPAWYLLNYVQNHTGHHDYPGYITVSGMNGSNTAFAPLYFWSPNLIPN